MRKYLLLLISAFAIAQTAPSRLPGLIITANQPTVTSTPNLTTTEANGLQGKISPVNLPLSNATATALETYTGNSSGALSGFLLTDNGNGTVNIASGAALLRSTNSEIGVLSKYTIPAVTNLALTDNANNFVLVNYNAGTPSITVTTDPATINTTTNSLLYVVSRVGNVLNHVYAGEQNVDSNGKLRRRFLNIEPITRAQGATISFTNRNISVTAGLFYAGLTPYATPLLGSTFTNVYNSASVWTRQTAQTLVNNTQYNVNGVLTTMNTGRFRVDYVYLLVNNPSQVYTVMGGAQYNNLAEARLAPLPSSLPVELQRLGVLVGRLIIEKDAAAITEVSSAYDVRFNASTVINHNDTGAIQGGAVGDYQHVTTAEKSTWNGKQNKILITPEEFGALGNGTTDDSVAIQAALDFLNTNGGTLFFSSKTYLCGNLKLYSNTTMLGSNATLKFKSGAQYLVSINEGSGGTTSVADNQKNINIKGISFVGRVVEDAFFQFKHLLNINAATNVKVENCSFTGFQGDGIYLGSSNTGVERHNTNIIIDKCFFDGINKDNRNGISVIDCDGLIISNSTFVNTTRSNMPGAIDVEPNPYNYAVVRNITISDNKLSNIGGSVAAISCYFPIKQETLLNPVYNINITNNSIVNCAYGIMVRQITDGLLLTTPSMDVIIYGNHVRNITNYGMLIENIKDIVIDSNAFIDISVRSHLGFNPNNSKIINSSFSNNYFVRAGKSDGIGLSIASANRLNVLNNYFEDCGKSDGTFGYAIDFAPNSTSDYITLSGNKISSPNAKTTFAIQKEATHTFTPANNVSINNQLIGVTGNNFVSSANGQPVSNSQLNALVSSGSYTPIFVGVANVSSVTANGLAVWNKIGNIVTVTVPVNITPTASTTTTTFTSTIPATRATANQIFVGSGTLTSSSGFALYPARVLSSATTTVSVSYIPTNTSAGTGTVIFQYDVTQ